MPHCGDAGQGLEAGVLVDQEVLLLRSRRTLSGRATVGRPPTGCRRGRRPPHRGSPPGLVDRRGRPRRRRRRRRKGGAARRAQRAQLVAIGDCLIVGRRAASRRASRHSASALTNSFRSMWMWARRAFALTAYAGLGVPAPDRALMTSSASRANRSAAAGSSSCQYVSEPKPCTKASARASASVRVAQGRQCVKSRQGLLEEYTGRGEAHPARTESPQGQSGRWQGPPTLPRRRFGPAASSSRPGVAARPPSPAPATRKSGRRSHGRPPPRPAGWRARRGPTRRPVRSRTWRTETSSPNPWYGLTALSILFKKSLAAVARCVFDSAARRCCSAEINAASALARCTASSARGNRLVPPIAGLDQPIRGECHPARQGEEDGRGGRGGGLVAAGQLPPPVHPRRSCRRHRARSPARRRSCRAGTPASDSASAASSRRPRRRTRRPRPRARGGRSPWPGWAR